MISENRDQEGEGINDGENVGGGFVTYLSLKGEFGEKMIFLGF